MPKSKAPYAQTPAVPAKKLAGTNPVGVVMLGSPMPGMVPKEPGKMRSMGMRGSFEQPHPHGFGHKLHHKKGHLRLSGKVSAHRIGAKLGK